MLGRAKAVTRFGECTARGYARFADDLLFHPKDANLPTLGCRGRARELKRRRVWLLHCTRQQAFSVLRRQHLDLVSPSAGGQRAQRLIQPTDGQD